MKKEELLTELINSSQRSIIIESGSVAKSRGTLITVLQNIHCAYSFDTHCGECRDCKRIEQMQKNVHPDLIYFGGDLFSIDSARNLIRMTQSEPIEFEERVVVIETEKLSVEAQNAILKLIEEDSDFDAKSKFIFITRNSGALLPTIQSRSITITLESNSVREFTNLVRTQGYVKSEYVSYLAAYKEANLKNINYQKEKFNLNVEDLYDPVEKIFKAKELTLDLFSTLDELRAYPFFYLYRAVEYQIIRAQKEKLKDLEKFYSLFYQKNNKKRKNVRDNLAVILQMWYFLNKRKEFDRYYKDF